MIRHLRPALLLGTLSAVLIALWLFQHRETWNDRAALLVLVWFLGGFLATFGAGIAVALLARLGFESFASAFRAVGFVPAFLLAGGVVYLVQNRIQVEGYELQPERPIISFFIHSAEIVAVFLYSAPHFLLPWMAPVMAIAGYALLPRPPDRSKG